MASSVGGPVYRVVQLILLSAGLAISIATGNAVVWIAFAAALGMYIASEIVGAFAKRVQVQAEELDRLRED